MRPDEKEALVARLHSALDRLDGAIRMIETGQPCAETMQQVATVQVALRAARRQLIQAETLNCLEILQNSGYKEQQREIVELLLAMYQI